MKYIILLLILFTFTFSSCDPTSTKRYYYCKCNLYGSATTGQAVYNDRVDKNTKDSDCDEIERMMKEKYDNASGTQRAECQVVEGE